MRDKGPTSAISTRRRAAAERARLLAAITANAAEAVKVEADKFAIVAQARAAGLTYQAIADAYGTNKMTVMRWTKRVSWPVPSAS